MLAKPVSSSQTELDMSAKIEVVKSLSINEGLTALPVAFCDIWMDSIIAYFEVRKRD